MGKQSLFEKMLANIDQQIGELQRARQIIVDARGPKEPFSAPYIQRRQRRTKAETAAKEEAG